jgi:hypothetical protein
MMDNKKVLVEAAKSKFYESMIVDVKAILLGEGGDHLKINSALDRLNMSAKVQARAECIIDDFESTMDVVKTQDKFFDSIMGHFGL